MLWYALKHPISIHALREEGDPDKISGLYTVERFLSTPSARRATLISDGFLRDVAISIHALREEGDTAGEAMPLHLQISIHALREEGDLCRSP